LECKDKDSAIRTKFFKKNIQLFLEKVLPSPLLTV
jgi:hypothetical protein